MLVALLVAIPVAALILLAIAYRTTLRDDDAWITRQYGAADAVVYLGLDCECDRRTPVENELPAGTQIVWGTESFAPVRAAAQDESRQGFVTTVDMGNPLLKGVRELAQGRWPENAGEVALDHDLANAFGVSIGDHLLLAHQESAFVVVGLIEGNNEYGPMIAAPGFDFDVIRASWKSDVGFIDLADSFDGSPQPLNISPAGEFGYETSNDRLKTTLGWLGSVLAMSVFGVVIAAAFAVSGRRQLANLAQLSASGVDRRTIVRALTMEGTVTGAMGAGAGLALAAAVHSQRPKLFGLGPGVVSLSDLMVIFATAVVIATIAALVPARSLGQVSVMSAMAGRRPVRPVSRPHAWRGASLVVGGLTVTALALRSELEVAAVLLSALGMMAVLLGVCALSPLLVEKVTGLAARGGGAVRLSARSIGRSGPRAASVFASLLLVGIAVTGVGARAEQGATGGYWEDRGYRDDLFWVTSTQTTIGRSFQDWVITPSTLPSPAETRQQAQDIVGEVEWMSVAAAYRTDATDPTDPNSFQPRWLIASDELLDLLDIAAERRAVLQDSPNGVEFVRTSRAARSPNVPVIVEPQLGFGFSWTLISPEAVTASGFSIVSGAVEFGVADEDLQREEIDALQALSRDDLEGLYYSDSEPIGDAVVWQVAGAHEAQSQVQANRVRLAVIAGSLLLVGLLVLIGMSLVSVEGRSERDLLIAVGAGPAAIARMAGWRAGGLAFAAMAIAVPSGLAISWLIFSSLHVAIAVPWLLGGLLVFAIPAAAGLVAWTSSTLAQRLRPLHSQSLAAD